MGWNYLQTDDRDDYFSTIGSKGKKKVLLGIDLTSPDGEKILDCAPMFKVRSYCKKNYLPIGNGGKRIWRGILLEKGYKVENIFE